MQHLAVHISMNGISSWKIFASHFSVYHQTFLSWYFVRCCGMIFLLHVQRSSPEPNSHVRSEKVFLICICGDSLLYCRVRHILCETLLCAYHWFTDGVLRIYTEQNWIEKRVPHVCVATYQLKPYQP